MENIVIFGLTDLAELLHYYLSSYDKRKVIGFTVDAAYRTKDAFCGLPVWNFEELESSVMPANAEIILAVGYNKMNQIRRQKFHEVTEKGYQIASFVHPRAIVETNEIRDGFIALENATVGPFCSVGYGNIFYPHSQLAHHSSTGDFNFFAVSSSVAGHVIIGDNCFFGNNCTTREKITIADFTLIGAGAYISSNTKSHGVYVPHKSALLDGRQSEDLL